MTQGVLIAAATFNEQGKPIPTGALVVITCDCALRLFGAEQGGTLVHDRYSYAHPDVVKQIQEMSAACNKDDETEGGKDE